MKVGFATDADLREFYGTFPTMRAVAAKQDGKVVGIVALVMSPQYSRLVSEFRGVTGKSFAFAFWRAARLAMCFVRESGRPVLALAEHDHGHKNLSRLGFTRIAEDCYLWPT